jgi:hypothetical protein
MLGLYENFPQNIHLTELFISPLSKKTLQQHFIQLFMDLNRKNFSFEEVGNPAVPGGTVIFEFGIADEQSFSYIDEEEAQKISAAVDKHAFPFMDLFCVLRYYKSIKPKKAPLKFDYYLMRLAFGKDHNLELQLYHERGPRYLGPQDFADFMVCKVNSTSTRKILKPYEPP